MIVRIIHVYVAEDSVEAFRSATIKNHSASIRESGVLRFDVLQDSEDSQHFVLYEVYRSIEATEKHKETDHYAAWKTAVEPIMAKDRERSEYTVVAPEDEGAW
jgi:quinol monooxygenase YgiN